MTTAPRSPAGRITVANAPDPGGARAPAQNGLRRVLEAYEAPTWALIVAVYGGWLVLTWQAAHLPWWLLAPLGGLAVTWHMHLQHELIHGHPTRWRRLNDALAFWPLALYLPYPIYRDTHLRHHRTPALTDPTTDPESFYVTQANWAQTPRPMRWLLTANNTLPGRLTIGPVLVVVRFLAAEARLIAAGDRGRIGVWALHAVLCIPILWWVTAIGGLGIGEYVLLFVLPGISLTLLRSFAEHRPAPTQEGRTAIVEGSWFTRLLFLGNNYHVVHHSLPGLSWYEIPRVYRRDRDRWIAANGGCVYSGYPELVRRHFMTPRDRPVHPTV